ncbi:urea ABC transporter ATP-binding subunit UrtE [Salicibibacter cibi]|uniref:Urea ABC transporter ATP-binding subunit UrtE n=1 Tax=Salicibibacter cibi TaxID=2743001 RepID=A0A7T6ZD27_9BACI|nr:urea ABC transporter ATP-binding subunit UrtE [Salicibibacter cibi]QQK81157.1 urea ABC transporter ATP-binding subunit UrtE [Salicibibacter cibi]
MLKSTNLEVGYGDSVVVREGSIEVKEGQVVCLMGRNGVGKSTLMKGIMGVLKPIQGELSYKGESMIDSSPTARAYRGFGYVPQGREIFGTLTVQENLLIGLETSESKPQTIPKWIYEYFPVLLEMKNRKGGELSGGQQQQLAIARALAANPNLLLLDEPTEGIQPNIVAEIQAIIETIKQKQPKLSILLIEQSFDFARRIADYYYIMDNGKIVYKGKELKEGEIRHLLSI